MTRKLIAIALLAIASLAAFAAFASRGNGGAVRGAAARAGMMARNAIPTAADYVQDGLIAMWDGIENAGWGVHNNNPSVWKNLVGNSQYDFAMYSTHTWTENSVIADGSKPVATCANMIPASSYVSSEVCVNANSSYGCIFFNSISSTAGNQRFVVYERTQYAFTYGLAGHEITASIPKGTIYVEHENNIGSYNAVQMSNSSYLYTPAAIDGNMLIGSRAKFQGDYGFYFAGNIYCIRIYNRALTAAEIVHNYSVDKRRFNLP